MIFEATRSHAIPDPKILIRAKHCRDFFDFGLWVDYCIPVNMITNWRMICTEWVDGC